MRWSELEEIIEEMVEGVRESETSLELAILEHTFNEPHCESKHVDPENRGCTHTVVATIVFPCGCSINACMKQLTYSQRMRSHQNCDIMWCYYCGADNMDPALIVILPRG